MTDIADLNGRFGLTDELVFESGAGGLVCANIDNGFGSATISLQGGHLLSWHPRHQRQPVVWLSEAAKFAPGKSIRGGVPVCWPWFGPHDVDAHFPAHGVVRTAPWQVNQTCRGAGGETEMTLSPVIGDREARLWPYRTALTLWLSVGETLKMALTTVNQDDRDVTIGEALHTYFQVGDVAQARLTGLAGVEYLDKLQAYARFRQAGALGFNGETDRVYIDTDGSCVIEDPLLERQITVAKTGSMSTVVWTPWLDRATQMGDLGQDGWRRMVCVESANAKDNVVTLGPGERHTLAVEYGAAPLV